MLDVYWDMQEHPDERWQTDIMYIKIRGRFFHLLIFIDEYSRYITRHALLTPMDADSVSMKAQAAIDILRRDSIAEPVIQSGNESSFSVPRNMHDRPLEVWFRKVWEHPNRYGHSYICEDMAEAARMRNRRPHQKRTHIITVRPYMGGPSRLKSGEGHTAFHRSPEKRSLPGVMAVACGESHVS